MSDIVLGEWEVFIRPQPWAKSNYIFLTRVTNRGVEYVTHDGTIHTAKEGEFPKTEDSYFARMDDHALQSLANALAEKGIKTNNDSKNEGLLEATREHLQDMRRLVFEDKHEEVIIQERHDGPILP